MFCTKCGNALSEASAFCPKCGQENAYYVKQTEESIDEMQTEEIISAEIIETAEIDEPVKIEQSETVGAPKEKPKKRRGAVSHIFASLLSVLLAVFVLATMFLASVRSVVSENTITNMISSIDPEDIKVEEIISKEKVEELGLVCESDNLLDVIYDNIINSGFPIKMTKEELRDIIEDEEFSEYFGKLFSKNISKLINGKDSELIEIEDVISFIEDERDTIEDIIGYSISNAQIEKIKTILYEDYSEVFETLEIENIETSSNKVPMKLIKVINSDWLLYCLIAIDVLIIALIILILRSFKIGFTYCGFTNIIAGLGFAIFIAVVINIIPGKIENSVVEFILKMVNIIVRDWIIIGCAVAFAGILMVIARIIIDVLARRKES